MRRYLILMILIPLLFLAGCEEKHTATLKVTSPAFDNNKMIPIDYTCDGENIPPPLNFSDIPSSAKSLAIVMEDPDAPGGTFVHWLIWNIPTSVRNLPRGGDAKYPQGKNDFGDIGYGGPCPPPGSGVHHYHFKVFALDTFLDLEEGATKGELMSKISGHVVAKGTLVGLYSRDHL